jgi:hypothetical protein
MAFLRANAAQAAGVAPDSRAAEVRLIWAWSLVHGLAMLMLDGQVPADESLVDEVVALLTGYPSGCRDAKAGAARDEARRCAASARSPARRPACSPCGTISLQRRPVGHRVGIAFQQPSPCRAHSPVIVVRERFGAASSVRSLSG